MVTRTRACGAKDPNTCRYHKPDAGQVAWKNVENAEAKYKNAQNLDVKQQAKQELENARSVYDATDHGFFELKGSMRDARMSGDWLQATAFSVRYMKAKLARVEERQTGAATETVFYDRDTLTQERDKLNEVIASGDSDHFYDVYDAYSKGLNTAIQDVDSESYVKKHNALIDELLIQSDELQWFDNSRKQAWVEKVKASRLKGKFYRTVISLDNTTGSSTFTV